MKTVCVTYYHFGIAEPCSQNVVARVVRRSSRFVTIEIPRRRHCGENGIRGCAFYNRLSAPTFAPRDTRTFKLSDGKLRAWCFPNSGWQIDGPSLVRLRGAS